MVKVRVTNASKVTDRKYNKIKDFITVDPDRASNPRLLGYKSCVLTNQLKGYSHSSQSTEHNYRYSDRTAKK